MNKIEQLRNCLTRTKEKLNKQGIKLDGSGRDFKAMKEFEIAYQDCIEKVFDEIWWKVTNYWDIFDSLLSGINESEAIEEIINHVSPEFLKEGVESTKVEDGHSYEEYMNKFGRAYRDGELWDFSEEDFKGGAIEINPDITYWKIEVEGEPRYFETLGECKEACHKEVLDEGTSNFYTSDYFPLLVFYTYDEVIDMMAYASDKPEEADFENEDGEVDYEAYEEARDAWEEKFWDDLDCAVLDEDAQERLEDKIYEFNAETQSIADRKYHDDLDDDTYYDLNNLEEIKVEVSAGYYEAHYISVEHEKTFEYLSDAFKNEQLERFNKFFRELESEFGLTEYEVAWGPASNGETGYRKVKKQEAPVEENMYDGKKGGNKGVVKTKVHVNKNAGNPKRNMEIFNHMMGSDAPAVSTGVTLGESEEGVARVEYCLMKDGDNVDCYNSEEEAIKNARELAKELSDRGLDNKGVRVLLVKYGPKDEHGDEPELGCENIWAVSFKKPIDESRGKGFVEKYKGYSIIDVGDRFVITDKNGLNVGETKFGLPVVKGMIDVMVDNSSKEESLKEEANTYDWDIYLVFENEEDCNKANKLIKYPVETVCNNNELDIYLSSYTKKEAFEFFIDYLNTIDGIELSEEPIISNYKNDFVNKSFDIKQVKKFLGESLKEGFINSDAKEIIAKNRDRNNVWYIDVKGVDQDGKEAWFSGNTMNQGQSGYGGFYSFDDAKKIFDTFEDIVDYSEEDIKNNTYDASITKFTPKSIFIGFAPIEDEDGEVDNTFVMTRRLIRTESLKEDKIDVEKELLANNFEKGECKQGINGNGICYYNYKGTGYFPEVVARLQNKVGKLDFVNATDEVVGIRHKDEALKEDIDEYDPDFDICCKDVAEGLEAGWWHGTTSSERSWGLTVNGGDGNQFCPSFADVIAYECSYPVRDGYFNYSGLDCNITKSSFDLDVINFEDESDRQMIKTDLLAVGCEESEIDAWLANADESAEIEFFIDYDIDIDDLEESDEEEYLSDKVTKVLDDYGILYGDIVENGDGTVNIVGVDEEEWDEVVEAIKSELGLDVLVPDPDHGEFDDELIVKECLKEASSAEKKAYKNGGEDYGDYVDGKAIARIKDPDERARAVAMKKLAKKGKLGDRVPVEKELGRKYNQAVDTFQKKQTRMSKAGYAKEEE